MKNIPNTWDECFTKEQKEAFKKELERLEASEKVKSFEDWIFESHIKELSN